MSKKEMLLLGIGLTSICGLILLFVYGLASEAGGPDAQESWSLMLSRMLEFAAPVVILASLGLLLGVAAVITGICEKGQSSKPSTSDEI
jgi:hypothetical protein